MDHSPTKHALSNAIEQMQDAAELVVELSAQPITLESMREFRREAARAARLACRIERLLSRRQ